MRRRDLLLAGSALVPACRHQAPGTRHRTPAIGVQLYTVRRLMQRDFEGTLRAVAAAGYREVEFAGYFSRTPAQVRAGLDANGLVSPSTHLVPRLLQSGWDRAIADSQAIGHRYMVIAWMPQEMRRTLDDWRRTAELFTRAGEAARREGLTFAYHNHDFEFTPLEGRLPFDVLLESTDPSVVRIQMDLFWIRKGGHDPLAYFARWPGRFPMVHVKDMDAQGRMVDVGAGVIDWPAIFAARRQAGIEHYFVEHDEPPDPLASIAAGYRHMRTLAL